MLSYLYTIFIMPIECIVEFIFYFMNKIFTDKPAISIMFVSLVINLCVLPLYKRADDIQEKEREKVKSMERWNKHIKKTFKGDERYMMQTAYYRIEGYKPLSAVTGSLSLLFQIPFFIAAYHFLSNLKLLNGVSFSLISDLGAPDGILKIGGLAINVLPILMTVINILSGVIYTKGFKTKEKVQLYAMALLFLVILYKSPAGLVLYWTCNNLFSLLKNVFFKLVKRKRLAINVISAMAGTCLFAGLVLSHRMTARRQFLLFGIILILSYVPLALSIADKCNSKLKRKIEEFFSAKEGEKKHINALFWSSALFLVAFLGLTIPSQLINSSPVEFGTVVRNTPIALVTNALALYVGFIFVWIGIFFAISGNSGKKVFAYLMCVLSICSLVNYYLFYGKFGTMDYLLKFVDAPIYNDTQKLFNLGILAIITLVILFVLSKWPKVCVRILSVLVLMMVVLGGVNLVKTHTTLKNEGYYEVKKDSTIVPTVPLSKDGKNVIVFMMDRALSEYVPYIFKEKTEIAEQFKDFVYYPNTVSFGGCTNFAVPALYGGYEYTPTEMNKRSDELLVDKHNESIKMLPVLFSQNNYEVSVVDPSYANYKEYPDVSIFDEYDGITGYTTRDKYASYEYHNEGELVAQKKHVAIYSLFRVAPVFLQNSIYDEGNYLGQPMNSLGSDAFFYCAEAYATLDYLDEYTYIKNGSKNTFTVMTNNLTHEPTYLQLPDYDIGPNISYVPYSDEYMAQYEIRGKKLTMNDYSAAQHYQVNVAAYKLLGKFFDHLKKEGIYDNTRIIIVSDHGWPTLQMENVTIDENTWIETFNPVLLVKDFADSDALKQGDVWCMEESNLNICDTLMTNADVATLCVTGTVENPVNPFTGKAINSDAKNNLPLVITSSRLSGVETNNGYIFDTSDYPWVEFSGGEVKDLSNWTVLYED